MKTTLDLPADLVREMKLRAAQMGCRVEEVATELLKRALAPGKTASAPVATKGTIMLPLFPSPKTAPASRMSTAELLALEQETLHQEDLRGVGLADCLLAAPAGAPPMTPERIKQILEETP
jgi:plasmid stability protein